MGVAAAVAEGGGAGGELLPPPPQPARSPKKASEINAEAVLVFILFPRQWTRSGQFVWGADRPLCRYNVVQGNKVQSGSS